MMKHLIGLCCAMLLLLSGCNDGDELHMRPSALALDEVRSLADLSYDELAELQRSMGFPEDYFSGPGYVFSGSALNGRFDEADFLLSDDSEKLSKAKYWDWEDGVYRCERTYYDGIQATAVVLLYDFYNLPSGIYYYCMATQNWGYGVGILNECMGSEAVETKSANGSFTWLEESAYRAGIYVSEEYVELNFSFKDYRYVEKGVCYTTENRLPTLDDQTYYCESYNNYLSLAELSPGTYYMRPFVITSDKKVIYSPVRKIER